MTGIPAIVMAATFGALVGSFLNVCIYRLPLGTSIVWPGSACPHCGRALAWFENIPIVSYLALRGRCRSCGATISPRYPAIEALTAALIVLFEIDREHQLLPHAITLPGILVGFLFSFFTEPGWQSSLLGILIGGGTLLAVGYTYYWLRHEEGLGMGDFKMLAMIGAFLGWPLTLVTLMMASFVGSIVGVFLIAANRGGMKSALPFGTFLAVGALAAATVGPSVLQWYLSSW
jgi:leader peptidase (prepilin peptidase)/N-methyltransferase